MIMLILLLLLASVLAYVSNSNLTPVSLNIGPYVFADIPLFYVIVGSLLVGLSLATLLHTFRDISYTWALWGKKKEINAKEGEVSELTKRIHELEIENEKLKGGSKLAQRMTPSI